MANECIPRFEPGATLTCHTSGAVVGKRLVKITADKEGANLGDGLDADGTGGNYVVGPCTAAGERCLGVAKRDAGSGAKVGVYAQPGIIVPIEAAAAITAGQEVMASANGRVTPLTVGAAHYAIGVAMADCSASGNQLAAEIRLYGVPSLTAAA